MRKHLAFAFALVCAVKLHAAIAVVQPTAGLPLASTACAAATSCNYVMPTQPTAGNALIAVVSCCFTTPTVPNAFTDTGVNTYSSTTAAHVNGGACASINGSCVMVGYATNIATAGSFNVTSHTSASTGQTAFAAEYSGVQTASPVDKQAQGNGTSTTPAVASQTATNANSLYVAAIVHDGAGSPTIAGGGSFTERAEMENTANFTQGYEDIISSAAQTGPFTIGASVAWADTMVIFIPASGGPPTRTLLGVGKLARR